MTEPGQPQPYDPPSGSQPYQPPAAGSAAYGQEPYGQQAYGQQGYGGQPYGAGPTGPKRNGLGVAALVLGILGLLGAIAVVPGVLLGVLAVVFGVIGRTRAKRGEATNGGLAVAGVVLGVLALLASAVLGFAGFSLLRTPEGQRYQQCVAQAQGDRDAIRRCQEQLQRGVSGSTGY